MEYLLLVDENNNIIGEEEKEKCHQGKGILHSAFLALVFNRESKLMLAKRSDKKKLWPNYWDGTVAGHFYKGESYEKTSKKRLFQEIGVRCKKIEFLFKFRYHAEYKNIGSENEICFIFSAKNVNDKDIFLNESEVSEYRFVSIQKLREEIEERIHKFTPWFLTAFERWLDIFG